MRAVCRIYLLRRSCLRFPQKTWPVNTSLVTRSKNVRLHVDNISVVPLARTAEDAILRVTDIKFVTGRGLECQTFWLSFKNAGNVLSFPHSCAVSFS